MHLALEILISALILIGGLFALIGGYGIAKLPDFFSRLHAPTKISTVSVGCMGLASMIYFMATDGTFGAVEILVSLFLVLTAPISANMMAKAAMHLDVRRSDRTRGAPWKQ